MSLAFLDTPTVRSHPVKNANPVAPPMLSAGHSCVADMPGDWFLVHVRSHHEKTLAWQLGENGFGYYLPLAIVRKKTASRNRITLILPLFDGYLFAAAPREADGVTNNLRLANFLQDHQHVFIDEYWGRIINREQLVHDLTTVEKALALNPALEVTTVQHVGQRVRVTRGPFLNYEGSVEGFGDGSRSHKVDIEIKTMGSSLILEIDASDLELAEYSAA